MKDKLAPIAIDKALPFPEIFNVTEKSVRFFRDRERLSVRWTC